MLDLQELHLLTQLVDNLSTLKQKLEEAYAENDAENFKESKQEILNVQKRINEIVSEDSK
jgi:predicted nuclease with TOPRIM domain